MINKHKAIVLRAFVLDEIFLLGFVRDCDYDVLNEGGVPKLEDAYQGMLRVKSLEMLDDHNSGKDESQNEGCD